MSSLLGLQERMVAMRNSKKSLVGALTVLGGLGISILCTIVLSATNIAPSAQAQSSSARKCSARTLNGAYGIKFEGQKLGKGPFVSIARIEFDGIGQFSTAEIGRFNGKPIKRTFAGPYKVNEDCTGYLDFDSTITDPSHEAHGDFVIVNGGQEFFVVDNEDDWATNGWGKKI
jgi:hypothetical protein